MARSAAIDTFFVLIFLIAALVPTDKLQYLPVRSIYKEIFHVEPYSVGLTRAMSRLFHGDVIGAWNFNKLVFPVFLVMLFLLISNLIKSWRYYQKTGKIYPKYLKAKINGTIRTIKRFNYLLPSEELRIAYEQRKKQFLKD